MYLNVVRSTLQCDFLTMRMCANGNSVFYHSTIVMSYVFHEIGYNSKVWDQEDFFFNVFESRIDVLFLFLAD